MRGDSVAQRRKREKGGVIGGRDWCGCGVWVEKASVKKQAGMGRTNF
jgi:hypothetical protein